MIENIVHIVEETKDVNEEAKKELQNGKGDDENEQQ